MLAAVVTTQAFAIADHLVVRRIGFGALRIVGPDLWGDPTDRASRLALLREVVDRGVNLIDTADVYGPAVSETLIAEALHPYPDGVVITTKGGRVLSRPGQWGTDCRPERLTACCEQSLRRLKLDCIDLYQLHAVDPDVPIEESVGALVGLRDAGKIRHIGLSNVSVDDLNRAAAVTPIASVQNRYNILQREDEAVLDACVERGVAFMPWQPLAKADLSAQHSAIAKIAATREASPVQVALSWLLHHAAVILPIPSTTNPAHLADNLAAEDLHLTADELRDLDALATPAPVR